MLPLYLSSTGVDFHPTVPGQLLARRRIPKCGLDYKKALYDVQGWGQLWIDMVSLANDRARYGQNEYPIDCIAPSPGYKLKIQENKLEQEPLHLIAKSVEPLPPVPRMHKASLRIHSKYRYGSVAAHVNSEANARFNHAMSKEE